jgi:hypothetical protein
MVANLSTHGGERSRADTAGHYAAHREALEIPVPKRKDVMEAFRKIVKPVPAVPKVKPPRVKPVPPVQPVKLVKKP